VDTLGLLDHLFYKADEYGVASLVMGGAFILAPETEPLMAEAVAGHLAARLEKIPALRKRMIQDPLHLGSVRRVDDPDFDVWRHITVAALPAPGGYRELTARIAEIAGQPLGLDELWHWWVLSGLEGGRIAVVSRLHHALTDGVGAVQVMGSLFDTLPVPPEQPLGSRVFRGQPLPSSYALLGDAVAEAGARLLIKGPQFVLRNTLPALAALRRVRAGMAAAPGPQGGAEVATGTTSLNISSGGDGPRSLAYRSLSIAELKDLARHHQCTLNDIALVLFSCALENYFASRGEVLDFDLHSAMPINLRDDSGSGEGNRVTVRRVNLHNRIADIPQRLARISRDSQAAKDSARATRSSRGPDLQGLAELIAPAWFDALFRLAARLQLLDRFGHRLLPFHTLLSNVPGPAGRLYVANGLMVESIPLIPAFPVMALSAGIVSSAGQMTFGFNCDGGAIADPEVFAEGVDLGLESLRRGQRRRSTTRARGRAGTAKGDTAKPALTSRRRGRGGAS